MIFVLDPTATSRLPIDGSEGDSDSPHGVGGFILSMGGGRRAGDCLLHSEKRIGMTQIRGSPQTHRHLLGQQSA